MGLSEGGLRRSGCLEQESCRRQDPEAAPQALLSALVRSSPKQPDLHLTREVAAAELNFLYLLPSLTSPFLHCGPGLHSPENHSWLEPAAS